MSIPASMLGKMVIVSFLGLRLHDPGPRMSLLRWSSSQLRVSLVGLSEVINFPFLTLHL